MYGGMALAAAKRPRRMTIEGDMATIFAYLKNKRICLLSNDVFCKQSTSVEMRIVETLGSKKNKKHFCATPYHNLHHFYTQVHT